MKKLFSVLICLLALFVMTSKVNASSFSLSLDGDEEFSDEITLELKVKSLTGFGSWLYGIESYLDYESNKLTLVSINRVNNFDVTYDISKSNKFVAYRETGALVNEKIVTFTFSARDMNNNETTTITISDIVGSDGENDVTAANVSKTIKYVKPDYLPGDLNCNGSVDLNDVISAIRKYLNVSDVSATDIQIADINKNGDIDLSDIIAIIRLYLDV